MQLCRFALRDDPNTARSGIFHESRVYETDGEKAIGVFELSKLMLLPPIAQPTSVRCFSVSPEGQIDWTYRNPVMFMGPLAEFDVPGHIRSLDFEVRAAVVMKEHGGFVEQHEATEYILGWTWMLFFVAEEILESRPGSAAAFDLPFAVGPFMTIPDELPENPPEKFSMPIHLKVGDSYVLDGQIEHPPFEQFIAEASKGMPLAVSDVLAGPAWNRPRLRDTTLGRPLRPGDSIQISSEMLGALTVRMV